jgi:hypothetical protein
MMLTLILLIFGIAMRFLPHEPNFTPVSAIALFGGVYLSKRYAILLPLLLMIFSDLVIGLHDTIAFTWGSFVLIAAMGVWLKNRKTPWLILASSAISALLFFLVTNFGAWLTDLYPHTWEGFLTCYTLAIPFFRNTLISSILYAVFLFGVYELIYHRVKKTRLARVLLTS